MGETWGHTEEMNAEDSQAASSHRQFVPRKSLTLVERIAVINEYDKSPNTRNLARIFGCGRTQIQNILRHRHEYLQEWENNGDPYRKRRRQSMTLLALGAIVCEWIQRSRACGIVVTDDQIRRTGVRVARLLTFPDFRPCRRWLERLKQKYKLFDLSSPLYLPASESDPEKYSVELEDIIHDLNHPGSKKTFVSMALGKPLNFYLLENDIAQEQGNSDQGLSNGFTISDSDQTCVYVLSESGSSDISDNDQTNDEYDFQTPITGFQETVPQPSSDTGMTKAIASYKEALNHLVPLEQFALLEEDIRAVGLINQLENLFTEKLLKSEKMK